VVALPAPVVTCAYCRGKGQTRRGAKLFCPVCQGRGLVSVAEAFQSCPQCHGSGATRTGLPCIGCKGTGVVSVSSDGRRASRAPEQGPLMISLREWKKMATTLNPLRVASCAEGVAPRLCPATLGDVILSPESQPGQAFGGKNLGEEPRPRRASLPYLASTLRQREKRAMLAGLRRARPWWQRGRERVPAGLLRSAVYHCAFCRGTGQSRGRRTKCPSCSGTGVVRVKPPVMRCALCHGRGRAHDNLRLACLACKGKGIHPVEMPLTRCPKCQGTGGWGAIPCTECGGKGVITERGEPGAQAGRLWEVDDRGVVRMKRPQVAFPVRP